MSKAESLVKSYSYIKGHYFGHGKILRVQIKWAPPRYASSMDVIHSTTNYPTPKLETGIAKISYPSGGVDGMIPDLKEILIHNPDCVVTCNDDEDLNTLHTYKISARLERE